jgi:hypothetical protein
LDAISMSHRKTKSHFRFFEIILLNFDGQNFPLCHIFANQSSMTLNFHFHDVSSSKKEELFLSYFLFFRKAANKSILKHSNKTILILLFVWVFILYDEFSHSYTDSNFLNKNKNNLVQTFDLNKYRFWLSFYQN